MWWLAWFTAAVVTAWLLVSAFIDHWASRPDYDIDKAWATFRSGDWLERKDT